MKDLDQLFGTPETPHPSRAGNDDQQSLPFSNPTTSKEAAESMRERAPRLREIVFRYISEHRGATCDEVEAALSLTHQTASARVNELMRADRIEDSGSKRKTRSGRNAIVWRARGGA